jgi:hypothetical protein
MYDKQFTGMPISPPARSTELYYYGGVNVFPVSVRERSATIPESEACREKIRSLQSQFTKFQQFINVCRAQEFIPPLSKYLN